MNKKVTQGADVSSKQRNFFNWFCSILTLIIAVLLFSVFVFSEWQIVQSTGGLFVCLLVLLVLSFFSSAIESSYTTTRSDASAARASFQERKRESDENYWKEIKAGNQTEDTRPSPRQHFKKLFKHNVSILYNGFLVRLTDTKLASTVIGAYATLSVVLNAILTLLLPTFLIQNEISIFVFNITDTTSIKFTDKFFFTAVFVTFSILVFGKVIPKAIGLNYPKFFIEIFWPVTVITLILFGWMSKGLTWFLK